MNEIDSLDNGGQIKMYAIVDIKGKNYVAEQGKALLVDKLQENNGDKITLDKILLFKNDENKVQVGNPYLKNMNIEASVLDTFKDKKITVMKFKRRKNYKKKQGHRQQITKIMIDKINQAQKLSGNFPIKNFQIYVLI